MIEFVRTRSALQWLAFLVWAVLIGTVVAIDAADGRTVIAATEAISYSLAFGVAALLGHSRHVR